MISIDVTWGDIEGFGKIPLKLIASDNDNQVIEVAFDKEATGTGACALYSYKSKLHGDDDFVEANTSFEFSTTWLSIAEHLGITADLM